MDHSQNAEERSPVFLQGLDCIYQILVQFPTAFEFSQNLLVFLADHVHSGLFGTFLGNSYRQRFQEMKVKENTQSIWSYVFDNKERFCNTAYTPYSRPIWPSYGMAKLVVWSRYFNRWGPDAHPSHNLGDEAEWHDDWGSGYETEKFTSGTWIIWEKEILDPRFLHFFFFWCCSCSTVYSLLSYGIMWGLYGIFDSRYWQWLLQRCSSE